MTTNTQKSGVQWFFAMLVLIGLAGGVLLIAEPALAESAKEPALAASAQSDDLPATALTNDECMACHDQKHMRMTLESGEEISLYVNQIQLITSPHGRAGLLCTDCHTNIEAFPHPVRTAETKRAQTLEFAKVCEDCHTDQTEHYAEGQHAKLLLAGDENSAVCTDCHGSHQIEQFGAEGSTVAQTCEKCHSEIYDIYAESVHGAALLNEANPDVPKCDDCHDSHANTGPSDDGYHLYSPQLCAECHADETMMNRYGVNTEVFDTYVADFHGTTIAIFEEIAPGQETNKPVCSDCHGVHNILAPDDENSAVIKANITETCARCHEGASPDFSDAWLSHYTPSLEHNPLVYIVDVFYQFLIPGVLGGMGLFIATDIYRNGLFKGHKHDDEEGK